LAVDTASDCVVRPLVLLVDFPDRPHPPAADNTSVSNLFFQNAVNPQNVAKYWDEVSYHKLAVERPSAVNPANPDVVGWLRAGDGTGGTFGSTILSSADIAGVAVDNVRLLLDNVISYLDRQGFDFSPYVRSSDNAFLSVVIVHPGYGAEDSGDLARDPYSHSAGITPLVVTSLPSGRRMSIQDYTLVPSAQFYNDSSGGTNPPLIGIGVIVHEMGHLLGLPDLYPTSTSGIGESSSLYSGVGIFDLMGYGLWGSNILQRADNPAHLSAWAKTELGWTSPTVLSAASSGRSLPPAETTAGAFKIYPNGAGDESQFFLLETRRPDTAAVFDKALPGAGVLIWRVDNHKMDAWRNSSAVPLSRVNSVNNDNALLGLALMEGDLDNVSRIPHFIQDLTIGAQAFGVAGDFFNDSVAVKVFSRTTPVDGQNATNSSPVIDQAGGTHLIDVGFVVTIRNFVQNVLDFLFDLLIELPYWKVFLASDPPPTLSSNATLSYGFDGSNRTWVGTADRGAQIYSLTAWKTINTFKSPRIQAMGFESKTESMWVGTDRSLEKVRLDAIVASFPDSALFPGFPAIDVSSIVLDRQPDGTGGASKKWIGGKVGSTLELMVVFDTGANTTSDLQGRYVSLAGKFASLRSGETITAMALDSAFSTDRTQDILYVGTSAGRIYRNAASDGSQIRDLYDPGFASNLQFEPMDFPTGVTLPGKIFGLAVDNEAVLWAATDMGAFAFARGDPVAGIPDEFNPFDLAGDNAVRTLMYFPRAFSSSGSHGAPGFIETTGVALQRTGQARPIVWVSYGDPVGTSESASGGAERIDPNVLLNPKVSKDSERLDRATMKFARGATSRSGPASNDLIGVAGDGDSLWFATKSTGAVRFGSGTLLSLDKLVYLNEDDEASVSLVKEAQDRPTQVVTVATPGTGQGSSFTLTLTLGSDGIYHGRFGFSTAGTDPEAGKILVSHGTTVEVTYRDTVPPFVRKATATWKKVAPFEDSLFIPGCFIATAAYGSAMAPEVGTLRRFRDVYLLTHPAGRSAVRLYYHASPPLAKAIARRPALRLAARFVLWPVCRVAGFAVETGVKEKAIVILLFSGSGILVLLRRRMDEPA
jgi:M6 family metalloprotease-like protein